MRFRNLEASEIDVRIAFVKEGQYIQLLLYKDARCDMNILDECVGALNWKRKHTRENKNCIVSIWDDTKQQWISKEDTGVESNTESEKGLASDSFKRACFNWGIGRELYTAPDIRISLTKYPFLNKYSKFRVYHLQTENGKIVELGIKANVQNEEKDVFKWKKN